MENKELLDTNRVTAERNSTEELEHTAEEISKQTKTNQNNQTRRQKTGKCTRNDKSRECNRGPETEEVKDGGKVIFKAIIQDTSQT